METQQTQSVSRIASRLAVRLAWSLPLVLLVAMSCWVTWQQQVSSTERDRIEPAENLVQGYAFSRQLAADEASARDSASGTRPRAASDAGELSVLPTPGMSVIYSVPFSLAGDLPLGETRYVVHLWTALLALVAAFAVFGYIADHSPPAIAFAVASTVICHAAFLDAAQAASGELPAIAAAFLTLRLMEHHFSAASPSWLRGSLLVAALAVLPLIQPYLAILFAVYLCLYLRRRPLRKWALGFLAVSVAAVPFVGLCVYPPLQERGEVTTDAVAGLLLREVRSWSATDLTWQQWAALQQQSFTDHFLAQVVTAPLPLLDTLQLPSWRSPLRTCAISLVLGAMALGVLTAMRRRLLAGVLGCWWASVVLVLYAGGSERYFLFVAPLFAYYFWLGFEAVGLIVLARVPESFQGIRVVMVGSAVLAAMFWVSHRVEGRYDPDQLYDEVYAALLEIRDRDDIDELIVPDELQGIAYVETGKRVRAYETLEPGRTESGRVALLCVHTLAESESDALELPEELLSAYHAARDNVVFESASRRVQLITLVAGDGFRVQRGISRRLDVASSMRRGDG